LPARTLRHRQRSTYRENQAFGTNTKASVELPEVMLMRAVSRS
jgi:hypothetical protein